MRPKTSGCLRFFAVGKAFFLGFSENGFNIYPTMWGPQPIAKLVNISPMSLWFIICK
jgi:hypothetical protein